MNDLLLWTGRGCLERRVVCKEGVVKACLPACLPACLCVGGINVKLIPCRSEVDYEMGPYGVRSTEYIMC